jgi:hypothetical protein
MKGTRLGARKNKVTLIILTVSVCLLSLGALSADKPLNAGEDSQGPWWMKQTAITRDGQFPDLKTKSWWPKAVSLKPGESFIVEEGEGKGKMLVRCELLANRSGKEFDAVVWVIDDDEDGSIRQGGDSDSDCYVADWDRDGIVDRMVDYQDLDGDNDPDEMDIRYFDKGRLNYSWFGIDIDDDGIMWSLRGYEYGGESYFESDPYGDNIFYMNKFNPTDGSWSPISECPFAFYDTDGDGFSEVVVRVSAVPLGYDPAVDPDYANNAFNRPWEKAMADMGIVNIRYSFDIDKGSSKALPLHYDFGFNLVGKTPYQFPGMEHVNLKRRPPQVTKVIPWKDMRAVADRYEARETGFSWHENYDDTTAIGFGDFKLEDWRWEGVFWVWERHFMENTGGPNQKWNVRREWLSRLASTRELYYSDVDKRIHLFGAEEGWLQIGNFSGLGVLGEIRMFDTDGNGYFDRWEVYSPPNSASPVRVASVKDERAKRVEFDPDKLSAFYLNDVLPRAGAANEKLMAAMAELETFAVPEGLKAAMATGPENYRRYAQDVARELQYLDLRDHFGQAANSILLADSADKSGKEFAGDLRWLKKGGAKDEMETTPNSHTAWRLARLLEELDVAYGQGDFDKAVTLLQEIKKLGVFK